MKSLTGRNGRNRAESPLRIAVCGGGASATLLLHALAKNGNSSCEVTLVDPSSQPGAGLAYATQSDFHLLNVAAARMSVNADVPGHFADWLMAKGVADASTDMRSFYAPRHLYGTYLREMLKTAGTHAPRIQMRMVQDNAVAARLRGSRWRVRLSSGAWITADRLVLATGNARPKPLSLHVSRRLASWIIDDPWDYARIGRIPRNAAVLLAGTGLTAADVMLSLVERGHVGPIIGVSRHGLLPRRQAPIHPIPPCFDAPYPKSATKLVVEFRSAAALVDDDSGVQSLAAAIRPFVPQIWDGLEIAQQRRLLRHVQSYWNNVRHRMAPRAFDRLAAARSSGQITIIKGRPLAVAPGTNGSALRVLARTGTQTTALAADFIVNSTGPALDPAATDNPLLLDMLKRGLVRTGPLGLGLDIDGDCRPIGRNGQAHDNFFVLGPLTKSRFWEITAIPEIRDQAARMAGLLCRAPP